MTTTVATFSGSGRYYSGEGDLLMVPKTWHGDGTVVGCIYLHGATQTQSQMVDNVNYPGLGSILRAVAAEGWPILGIYAGGDTWGNDTGIARVTSGITYLQGTIGAKTGKVVLIGGSMGGGLAQTYAGTFPGSVAAVVGLVPVSDLQDFVTNNRGGLAASVNAAYSGAYSNGTYGAAHNPTVMAANGSMGTVPYKAWYGASDTIVLPATVTTCVSSWGATASAVSVAGDHNTALNSVTPADVVAFIKANAS